MLRDIVHVFSLACLSVLIPLTITAFPASDELIHRRVTHNICEDRVHTGLPRTPNHVNSGQSVGTITELLNKTLRERIRLTDMKNRMKNRALSCVKMRERLDSTSIDEFIVFEPNHDQNQHNSVTSTYIKISQLVSLFHVLRSKAMEECCLDTVTVHKRVRDSWFFLHKDMGTNVSGPDCHTAVSVTPLLLEPTCEVLNKFIYVALGHSITILDEAAEVLRNIPASVTD